MLRSEHGDGCRPSRMEHDGAVQRGTIVELDDDVASRWGPRVVEFMETVAAAIGALVEG